MKPFEPPEHATPFDADGLLLEDVHTLADLNAADEGDYRPIVAYTRRYLPGT
jgi:hypothetical protein